MPGLILKSPYIKYGGKGGGGGYLRYIGTRDGVELVPDDRPATKRHPFAGAGFPGYERAAGVR